MGQERYDDVIGAGSGEPEERRWQKGYRPPCEDFAAKRSRARLQRRRASAFSAFPLEGASLITCLH